MWAWESHGHVGTDRHESPAQASAIGSRGSLDLDP